ncbi:ABC transporter ATP-binding protein [Rhizobium sp. L1K21]|uniref:ABC transporter ATP-binding protein n=1 Tax=Rhizobium sp. L1K21 TaxID=2954933 RepID=UPI002091FFFF|nr:ABC transporter ATP-binding protein [Rhizobium sp. L1K21]MCO6187960.1 ABC transporter ATP-binding protein [Rhizobium sp. L1K21]
MSKIELKNATVEYPIYHADSMSLRNKIVSIGTGGTISRGVKNIVTVKALDDVSFTLEEGDRVGLIGHNGSGKSTLLRTLAGIYTPTGGSVTVDGKISTIFDLNAGLDTELSGYENIVRMAMFLGASGKKARAMIPEIEDFAELGDFLSMPVRTYSAGMLTRLAFAVATAVEPEILLIDEVIGAGDQRFQERAKERLINVVKSAKIMVLASHSDIMIELYCNRALTFEHGKLIKDERF